MRDKFEEFEDEIQRSKKSNKPSNNRRKKQNFKRQVEEAMDEYYEDLDEE